MVGQANLNVQFVARCGMLRDGSRMPRRIPADAVSTAISDAPAVSPTASRISPMLAIPVDMINGFPVAAVLR